MLRLPLPTVFLLAACLILAACAVPLGPGYNIEKQQVELTYSPDAPQTVRVRATYRLKNAGNTPMAGLDLQLPAQLAGQQARLRVQVEGRDASLRATEPQIEGDAAGDAAAVTVVFAAPVAQKKKIALVIEYDLQLPAPLEAFFIAADDWFPAPVPPDKLFAEGRPRADKVDLRIRVPEGWRALSSGRDRGSRRVGTRGRDALREYRFEIKRHDFDPYVIAGKYHEQRFRAAGREVVFWTLQPAESFQADATSAIEALAALEGFFGPRRYSQRPTWVVEAADALNSLNLPMPAPDDDVAVFADGVLLSRGQLTPASVARSSSFSAFAAFLDRFVYSFLWTSYDTAAAAENPRLDVVLAAYAATAAGPDAAAQRGEAIRDNLELYAKHAHPANGAEEQNAEKTIARGTLFLYALEDRIGKEHVQRGLRRVIQGMQGSTYGWNEIRSALEAESGQNLAEMVRAWLGDGAIPEEFRNKYAKGSDE